MKVLRLYRKSYKHMARSFIKYAGFIPALLSISLISTAQRGGNNRGGNGGGGDRGASQNRGGGGSQNPGQNRGGGGGFSNRGNDRQQVQSNRNGDFRSPGRQSSPAISRPQQRDFRPGNQSPNNRFGNRGPVNYGNRGPGNYGNRGPVNYGNRGNFRGPVINRNYGGAFRAPRYTVGVPYYGQRFTRLSHPYINLSFGGSRYNYYNGIFYRPFGSYFQVVAPPIGIHINLLPVGYRRIYVGANPYYYYNGTFYNQYQNDQYVVVDPPLGAKLPELPAGAKVVTINGQPYYENDGTYYAAEYNENNEILYTVVGVHGVLNDAQVAQVTPYTEQDYAQTISTLPPNCRQVTINGQKLYLSPDDIYYQEILDANGNVSYQEIGSANP